MRASSEPSAVTIAAAGDLHARPGLEARLQSAVERLEGVDLVLLAGDLTASGDVEEARLLADALRLAEAPVAAVLGNHDHHGGDPAGIATTLRDAGVSVLEGDVEVYDCGGVSVGVVGTKGFIGGFRDSRMPDFGERSLRELYAETGREVDALERGLTDVAPADLRIVLLHYAPTTTTLRGERDTVWTFLGSERLSAPIARHCPDLVFHGHAHAGIERGAIGSIPVFNVAAPVIGCDFRVFVDGEPCGAVSGVVEVVSPRATPEIVSGSPGLVSRRG